MGRREVLREVRDIQRMKENLIFEKLSDYVGDDCVAGKN
jgi:hypothetical protein